MAVRNGNADISSLSQGRFPAFGYSALLFGVLLDPQLFLDVQIAAMIRSIFVFCS